MTRGLLQEIKLAELIQLVGISERTGTLALTPLAPARHQTGAPIVGQLVFREGVPHAAFLAGRVGNEAAENLFLWEAGFFNFQQSDPATLPPANLVADHETHASLILRGLDRLATWNTARSLVPTLRAILHRTPPRPDLPSFPPETPEGEMLARCDGTRQLDAIGQQLGLGRLRCREVAARLLTAELAVYGTLSVGEKLVRAIAIQALPTLGIAADLFTDDALLSLRLSPEHLANLTTIDITTVQGIIIAIARSVAETLDALRAEALARHLSHALEVPYAAWKTPSFPELARHDSARNEVHHV